MGEAVARCSLSRVEGLQASARDGAAPRAASAIGAFSQRVSLWVLSDPKSERERCMMRQRGTERRHPALVARSFALSSIWPTDCFGSC